MALWCHNPNAMYKSVVSGGGAGSNGHAVDGGHTAEERDEEHVLAKGNETIAI